MKRKSSLPTRSEALLKAHREHMGLYMRVADSIGVSSSLVSRVATGNRANAEVMTALIAELERMRKKWLAIGRG
jgi:hypothetical protein